MYITNFGGSLDEALEVINKCSNADDGGLFVAEKGQFIVGCVGVDQTGKVEFVIVHDKVQNKGIGRKLFRFALESRQIPWNLEVCSRNNKAISLYLCEGFVITDLKKNAYTPEDNLQAFVCGCDALYMSISN